MPTVTKLAPEAAGAGEGASERERIAEQYDAMLADFQEGDWGDVVLEAQDKRLTVRSRLKAAAARRGLGLRFRQRRDDRLRFQLVAVAEPASRPAPPRPEAEAPAQQTPSAPAQQRGEAAKPRPPATPPPGRQRSATDRYKDVLPRWMREGQQPRRPAAPKRRTR
jgi:hypothetical protein